MSPEPFPPQGKTYRLSKCALDVGAVAISVFALLGILSAAAALVNADGSFRHPVEAAVFIGILSSCLALPGVWLILAYFRHRLFVGPDIVRVTDCFKVRQVRLANVTHVAWKSLVRYGTLILKENSIAVKISFSNYTFQDCLELICFFRTILAGRSQEGWERFESRCMPPQMAYSEIQSQIHGHLRFAAIAFAAAIPLMYAILIWQEFADGLPNGHWLVVAILPPAIAGAMLGMMWLTARWSLARAGGRQDHQ